MKTFKMLIVLIYAIVLVLGFIVRELTIGKIWSSFHVNSLIGFQKFIENLTINEKYNLNIWYSIIFPIINNSIFIDLIILTFIIFIFLKIKN
jgi:hypothetical protein